MFQYKYLKEVASFVASLGLLSYAIERELPKRDLDFSLKNLETATIIPVVHRTYMHHFSVIKRSTVQACSSVLMLLWKSRQNKAQSQLAASL